MNNTPAWLTIAVAGTTALVAILTASITTWLTTRSANTRFTQELEHQRELERRKLLFGLRSETYMNITQVFADVVDAVQANYSSHAENNDETVANLAKALRKLQYLVTSCVIIASDDVTSQARTFGGGLRATLDWLARPEMSPRATDFDDVWNPTVDAFHALAKAMRLDLGSIHDESRDENIDSM